MKRLNLFLILFFVAMNVAFAEKENQPLKLTIKTDKQVYSVGEDINITYTIENISSEPVGFYENSPGFQFKVIDNREYEIYPPPGSPTTGQFMMSYPEYKVLKSGEKLVRQQTFAQIRSGKVYKSSGGRGHAVVKTLIYDGFHIIFPAGDQCPSDINKMFIKNGFGNYSVSLKFCDGSAFSPGLTIEDCSSDMINSLDNKLRENAERHPLSSDEYNSRYFKILDIKSYCKWAEPLKTAWKGCINSNVIEIQIVEAGK